MMQAKDNPVDASHMNEACLVGRIPHLEQIKFRLDFLQYILHNSDLVLTLDQVDFFELLASILTIKIDQLWDTLVLEPISSEEQDVFLTWLGRTSIPQVALESQKGVFIHSTKL